MQHIFSFKKFNSYEKNISLENNYTRTVLLEFLLLTRRKDPGV